MDDLETCLIDLGLAWRKFLRAIKKLEGPAANNSFLKAREVMDQISREELSK